jgi:hypothetical protein
MFIHLCIAAAPGPQLMRPFGKSAAEALAESPLARLLDQARMLGRVSSLVAEFCQESAGGGSTLPPLHCSLNGRSVIITVATPSQAAKLRQRAAALHQLLQDRVPELTGIRIRLQPGREADPNAGTNAAELPRLGFQPSGLAPDVSAALRFAEDLSAELPDSPLRRSAQRLQATLRARLRASRQSGG